jgi:glycosyltransferase involved in cell wall biosynthesis
VNEPPTVRILAMMEAASLTGPAKNLIGFGRWLRSAEGARTGLTVAIATFDRNARAYASDGFAGAARAAGIDTHVIHERYRFDPGVIPQLREIIAKAQPNIIQTHNNKSHLLLKLLPKLRKNRQWFAFHHGDVYSDFKQRLYNQVDRVSLRSADRVVSVCAAFAPRLVAYGVKPERMRFLHNAAMPLPSSTFAERAQLRAQLGIGSGEAVVLSIGRLSREKGHADLLRALQRLRAIDRQWKLVLVGVGPERAALGKLAGALGISERVVFAGFRPDVSRFYSIADVFVLPSHSEGSANVLLEAMMARVPIAATMAGGTPEIIVDEKTGLLTGVGEPQGLAEAIARLLVEPELVSQFVEAAFARATREFSLDRYRQVLSGFYAEAIGSGDAVAMHTGASVGGGSL